MDADTDWVSVTVEVSDAEATLWTVAVSGLGQPGVSASGTQLFLDRTYDRFGNGAPVLVTDGTYTRPFTLSAVATTTYRIAADTTYEFDDEEYTLPGASVPVTVLTLDTTLNDPDRMAPADQQVWDASDAQHLRVVGSWRTAGRAEAPEADDVDTTTIISDGIDLAAGSDSPFGDPVPTRFNLVDRDLRAVPIRGALDWSSGRLTIDDAESFWPPLRYPIQIHANIVTTTRGETVTGDVLGSGDAAATNQVLRAGQRSAHLPRPRRVDDRRGGHHDTAGVG